MLAESVPIHSILPTPGPERTESPASASQRTESAGSASFAALLAGFSLGKKAGLENPGPALIGASAQGSLAPSGGKTTPSRSLSVKRSDPRGKPALLPPSGRDAALSEKTAIPAPFFLVSQGKADGLPASPSRKAVGDGTRADAAGEDRKKKDDTLKADRPGASGENLALAQAGAGTPAIRKTEPKDDGPCNPSEVHGDDRRKAEKKEAKVSVVDMRMKPEAVRESKDGGSGEVSANNQENVQVGTRQPEGAAPAPRPADAKPAQGASFSDILARHLSEAGAQDIVKAAQIVLKDGEAGLIRLRLEPDTLGNVKIELKLTEKNIAGRIVVETDEAKCAFEKSLAGLRDAFSAGGFETASLEVSVGGGGSGGRGGAEAELSAQDRPWFSDRLSELDASVPVMATPADRREHGVNILA